MTLYINGEEKIIAEVHTIAQVIQALNITQNRIAIELNGTIIPRHDFERCTLEDQDRIEIVEFVSGG